MRAGAAALLLAAAGAAAAAAAPRRAEQLQSGRWLPSRGVVDGQGCNTGRCGDGDIRQPYFVWTRWFFSAHDYKGGQIYFEHRGDHGDAVLYAMLLWVALFVAAAGIGALLRGKYQPQICPPPRAGTALFWIDFYSPVPLRVTWAEGFASLWIIGWLTLCFLYVYNHAWINNLVGQVPRGIGGIVAGALTLQLFPVARHGFLWHSFGIPFERALKFHKKLGFWIWICMTVHFIGMWWAHARYYEQGRPNFTTRSYVDGVSTAKSIGKGFERLVKWEIGYPHGPPLAGFLTWIVSGAMILTAAFLRRSRWNLFVMLHLLHPVVYLLAWIHYPSLMIFSALPVFFYVLDTVVRWVRSSGFTIEEVEPRSGDAPEGYAQQVTFLRLRKPGWVHEPGQWAWLQIEGVGTGFSEWHPFSVSNPPNAEGELTFHVLSRGPGQWTDAVGKLAKPYPAVRVQGPFGRLMVDVFSASTLYLCIGGSGITPAISIIAQAARMGVSRVALFWAVKNRDAAAPFVPELEQAAAAAQKYATFEQLGTDPQDKSTNKPLVSPRTGAAHRLELTVFVTRGWKKDDQADVEMTDKGGPDADGPAKGSALRWDHGRPRWDQVLAAAPGHIAFASGPGALLAEVDRVCMLKGIPLHREVFEL
eukprot:TRINITY_DN3291_c0_g3_i1.p1 TRINITY_DN3291_c0_g3~~TRINITY_DN3291_c0_g3_i1.p1  ORF type:complete len:644 (+),score=166.06 TRINITY_DN3291_c0_g3_i1:78-2009(+)